MIPRSPFVLFPILFGAVCLSAVSCVSPTPDTVTRTEPIDQRDTSWTAEIRAEQDFVAEKSYIKKRRVAVGVPKSQETIALCFSGGGLRASTIQLGVLQGLEQADLLRKADYLSSVSGGSYVASWYVSHLLHPNQKEDVIESTKMWSKNGGKSYVKDRKALLQLDRSWLDLPRGVDRWGAVEELEDNRGFVFGRNYVRAPLIVPSFLATVPVNFVFDVVLHYKPTRGKFNIYHPTFIYQKAIHRTFLSAPTKLLVGQENDVDGFFDGEPHQIRMQEVNPDGHQAPYLVVGATLANHPHPAEELFDREVGPFEFSRYACGAPFLGYVHSQHFGFPVENVRDDFDGSGAVVMRANSVRGLSSTTDPLKLSAAVAASGAALDSNALGKAHKQAKHSWPPNSNNRLPEKKPAFAGVLDFVLKPLNMNLRQQQRNFSMRAPTGNNGEWTLADGTRDRLREVTVDRLHATVNSNSLILSDGGHYDNLGVFAMTQRKDVKEIWSFDATQDKGYKFGSWKALVDLLDGAGWKVDPTHPGQASLKADKNPDAVKQSPVFRFVLTKGQRTIDLYLVKSSYLPGDTKYRSDLTDGERTNLEAKFANYQRGGKTGGKFPHTSTFNLTFKLEDYHAYREMGRILALQMADERP